ncbi:hypothetical protein GYH30_026371 [Glycine max]|uniref:Bifunctional inhibitor/plant lipid transfer protein/seed storage helical domain-containing protein n=2 Tax=Glycine subgen. Soja TaxID=1462606 RepID=K7LGG7_SOYBN|nr:hypothetical protein GYH30_026371 [Glycine max]RZB94194.1 hypothetical protein D0Y65_025454 [Glycine soja]
MANHLLVKDSSLVVMCMVLGMPLADAALSLKTIAQSIPRLNLASLAGLPAKCGVNLPFKASPSIDCNM